MPTPPQVLSQRRNPDQTVSVTFRLAGLQTATLRVPAGAWQELEHLRVAPYLREHFAAFLPPTTPDAGELQRDELD